jgi:tetrahydromethanopterin S-methyltransferase subunit G
MSALSTKLRNAAMPNAWFDPHTFVEAADRIDELEAQVLELQSKIIEVSTPPKRGRPPKSS